jgi:hypothetical protein
VGVKEATGVAIRDTVPNTKQEDSKNRREKLGIGSHGILGYENALLLVKQIKRQEASGFVPTSTYLRALA